LHFDVEKLRRFEVAARVWFPVTWRNILFLCPRTAQSVKCTVKLYAYDIQLICTLCFSFGAVCQRFEWTWSTSLWWLGVTAILSFLVGLL